jgi:putative ATPase
MRGLGYGKGYLYPHSEPGGFADAEYFPDSLAGRRYYFPKDSGVEREIGKRLEAWRRKRKREDPK